MSPMRAKRAPSRAMWLDARIWGTSTSGRKHNTALRQGLLASAHREHGAIPYSRAPRVNPWSRIQPKLHTNVRGWKPPRNKRHRLCEQAEPRPVPGVRTRDAPSKDVRRLIPERFATGAARASEGGGGVDHTSRHRVQGVRQIGRAPAVALHREAGSRAHGNAGPRRAHSHDTHGRVRGSRPHRQQLRRSRRGDRGHGGSTDQR